ncbi:MAG TPA: hypothetical protein PK014_14700 [Thermoanaerobaculia bacterium]|nr:hypothetical protein [Thermoanaerobaculia bacterium]HUM30059.1 hypothetical protein [Thermoanaerobaculia bacterium]HXK69445.1 hypothetical protein [Thermoanaerobaculia bacterium]
MRPSRIAPEAFRGPIYNVLRLTALLSIPLSLMIILLIGDFTLLF